MATYTGESTVQASSSLQAYLAGPMRISNALNASSTVQGYLAGPMRISQALNTSSTTKGFLVIASHPAEALVASSGALYPSEVMTNRATSALSGTVRVRSTIQQDGGTNDIGLVILGSAELAPQRSIATSGTNREYGYWRGSYGKDSIAKFDQMYVPLEGSGVDSAGKPVISLITDQGKSVGSTDHPDCLASSKSFEWQDLGMGGGYWGPGEATCLTGCDDPDEPSFDGSYGGQVEYRACKGTPYDYYTGSDSQIPDGIGAFIGSARWEKAGSLLSQLGDEAPRQRCLFMSKRSFVNLGSGIDLTKNSGAYTAYAKVVPSGDVSGSVIMAQHRENPAQFILGCDYDGRYYIRSDYTQKDENYSVQVNSSGNYESYKYPTQIIGTYDQSDSTLKLYVNGKLQGVSDTFTRSVYRSEVTNVALGKREYALAEKGFTGWIDEVGLSSSAMEQKEITRFYQSTFEISKILFNTKAKPTGDSSFAEDEFGDEGLGVNNDTYVELTVESGVASVTNPEGARGGAFDTTMWGTRSGGGLSVGISSVLTFDLMEIAPRFHQLTDLSVDMWVQNTCNQVVDPVADVSARIVHKDRDSSSKNLNWYSTAVAVPTGDKRLITLTKDIGYDAYYQGGHKSFKQDLDDHQLEIVVVYSNDHLDGYDASFKIYNTKINYTGFDSLATYNTQTGLTEAGVVKGHGLLDVDGNYTAFASGDQSLTMVSLGGVGVPASGTCTLFVDSDTADQAMTLVINQDKATNMGNSGYGYVVANGAVEMNGVEMNLFTSGGQINTDMILFLKQNDPVFAVSPTMTLSTAGALLSFPREEANTSLYLLADLGFGSPSGVMNLTMPNVKSGTFFDKRLLYIEGKQPTGEIPLYVQVNESGVNTIPLYTVGPDFYSPSGVMNMFIKQKDLYGQATITPVPTVGRNNNTTLMTQGYSYPSGIMTMSVPNVFGSGTNSLTLSTRGSN